MMSTFKQAQDRNLSRQSFVEALDTVLFFAAREGIVITKLELNQADNFGVTTFKHAYGDVEITLEQHD